MTLRACLEGLAGETSTRRPLTKEQSSSVQRRLSSSADRGHSFARDAQGVARERWNTHPASQLVPTTPGDQWSDRSHNQTVLAFKNDSEMKPLKLSEGLVATDELDTKLS